MSNETDAIANQIDTVDVNELKENGCNSEKNSDSGVETADTISSVFLPSSDSETSPVKSISTETYVEEKSQNSHEQSSSDSPSGSSGSPEAECFSSESSPEKSKTQIFNGIEPEQLHNTTENNLLNTNQNSINDTNLRQSCSLSVENISKDLDQEQILSQFMSQKSKVAAVQKIPETSANLDLRYPRIPKEILSQDIGSIVKNVHGIFSSVSGSFKNAYTQRIPKPTKIKTIPNSKVMSEIFEDDSNEPENQCEEIKINQENVAECNTGQVENKMEGKEEKIEEDHQTEIDPKSDVLRLQIESLERLLFEQRKENTSLRERVKQQVDEMQEKDQTFKELEGKLDLMSKRVEQAEREKDAAVMRYASVECAGIEAKRAAETASKAEKTALAEVELLQTKLKSAHSEKQRIIQLYDDKCHELSNTERELYKVREDMKELEGRLKWTQSKLRMEMDAYKDSSERVEKLSQQISELESAKESAAANATDAVRARQLEQDLKECRAALILCRHEKEELDRRLSSLTQQLDTCVADRDTANDALARANKEVEQLRINNLRLEEEAAELAALRAKAALADTLTSQLQRESNRATMAEEQLSLERAQSATCAKREAAALRHAEQLTQQHVQHQHLLQQYTDKAQALSADNASLREQVTSLQTECTKLKNNLLEEEDRRNKENRVLARKVAELTEELTETNKKLEWEKGENGVLKKKHASAIKELNRELQRALKRCEQLEAKLPQPTAPSTRTGSITSLSSSESAIQEDRLTNGHADTVPDIQVREPDRQALIERIVSLQRAAARRSERCEFLEEHCKQLTDELRNKSRLLRHMLCSMPAGTVTSEHRDVNKVEMARLGSGAMAAVWGGDPGGMSLELSLEMNRRLQAVLEDTLLKNITLKENMDTLGAEISRLKEKNDAK